MMCLLNISSCSYFCTPGAGNAEMEKLKNGPATGAEEVTRQLSAQSVVEGSKKPIDTANLDVSQLRICFT
jgi:hypothetical protein